ncbi:unnamed protein product, partial [Hapterophycus canaliculatus]
SKFSSFVRQLNFYGFRKVKSSASGADIDSRWWEFKHDLFHRDKSHLLSDMRRATHYGVAADKQEVVHLRSEVTRLRSHIDDMGDKIGHLTSLVESLSCGEGRRAAGGNVEPAPSPRSAHAGPATAATRGYAGGGSRLPPGAGWGGAGDGGSDELCGVRTGLGRLSFGASGDDGAGGDLDVDQEEEDSRFCLPPPAPAGACGLPDGSDLEDDEVAVVGGGAGAGKDPAFTGFLPLRAHSRKRKLVRFDGVFGSSNG